MAVTGTASTRRASWGLWVRILVSAVLLAVLVSKINLDNVLPRQRHLSTLCWLLAGLGFMGIGILLSAWRWQRVLAVFDRHVRLRTLTSHYFAGQFVGNLLPSTIGGDVLRVTRGARSTGSAPVSFASVAIERLSGFVALPVLVALGFVLRPSLLDADHAWMALAIAGGSLLALGVILVLAGSPRLAGRFAEHENWMRFIGAVHIGVDRLRHHPRMAWGVLGAAVVYQASLVAAVYCAVRTLDVSVPMAAVVAFISAVAMAQVLPLSLGGLGVREGMLVVFLQPLGVSAGKAVGIGLLWYAMMLTVSLIGAPAFAMGHRLTEPDPAEPPPADEGVPEPAP